MNASVTPGAIRPGQENIAGTRGPPSQPVPFSPRNGPAEPPNSLNMHHGPLSLVNRISVFSRSPCSSRQRTISPIDQSSSSTTSPYSPALLLPANGGAVNRGTCGMLCAR